jgi:hypothetical protein
MEAPESVIALLLIRHELCAATDYGVIRCLERHFGWLHWAKIKRRLLANGYLIQLNRSSVPAYSLTVAGEPFSLQFREQALAALRQDPFTHREHTRWLMEKL